MATDYSTGTKDSDINDFAQASQQADWFLRSIQIFLLGRTINLRNFGA